MPRGCELGRLGFQVVMLIEELVLSIAGFLPLAGRVILAGIRTSVTINIATAAIGSTIGARTLGDPIIAGLVNGNTAYVLQGAILIGLLALTTDSLFEALEQSWERRVSPQVMA